MLAIGDGIARIYGLANAQSGELIEFNDDKKQQAIVLNLEEDNVGAVLLGSSTKIKEGDYIGVANVGAYGMSLSSNYNVRPSVAEILVSGSKHRIIKKRQSLESLINN